MNDTRESIIKGCKFILTLGADKWDSSLTKKAIARLQFLCELQDREWNGFENNEPAGTVEDAVKIFGGDNEDK